MQLNMTKEEKQKLVKEKKYFNCRKPGHYANKCRKPRKNLRPANSNSREQIVTMIPLVHIKTDSEYKEIAGSDKESDLDIKEFKAKEQELEWLVNYELIQK